MKCNRSTLYAPSPKSSPSRGGRTLARPNCNHFTNISGAKSQCKLSETYDVVTLSIVGYRRGIKLVIKSRVFR